MNLITKRVKTIAWIIKTLAILDLFLIYPVLAAYPDINLVANMGFESGTTAPLNWTFVTTNENTPVWSNISHSGSKSIEINIPGTTDLQSGYPESDRIIVQPFTTYTFSAWGKTQEAGGTNMPTIILGELDADKNLLSLTNLPVFSRGTNDWEQKTVEFQTGPNTSYIYIYANIWGGYGTFWMDDVTISLKTNLVVNPGFESGTTAPLNWAFVSQNGNTPIWSDISHTGSRSIEINIPGTIDLISGYPKSDRISVQPFTAYTFSAWGKTQDADGTNMPTITFGELDANKNLLRLTNLPLFSRGTNDWEQKILEFQTGWNTFYIYFYANIPGGHGTFWMDDVTVSLKPNLVVNPGFENGTISPLNWTFVSQNGNTPIWSDISHSGSRSVEINIPGTIDLISGYPKSDRISVQPFTAYTFSAWGKTRDANGTNMPTITFAEQDADKNLLRLTNLPLFSRGTNDWEQKTLEFQTGSNTSYIYFYANIWGGYGTFWMDDVTISLKNILLNTTPLPIPTTTPLPIPTTTIPLPVPTPTVIPTPLPTSLPSSCSYIISTDGKKVYAKKVSTGNIEFSGTLNEVLSFTAKSGNQVCIKNGVYSLSIITLQPNVIIDCESNNVIIKSTITSPYSFLIYIKSDSTIKNCTFDHKGKVIYVKDNVNNWRVENNHFINTNAAVAVINLAKGFPTNGYGQIINNTGLYSSLGYIQGGRNITISNNKFLNYNGQEFFDFNYNVHYVLFENNEFINADGYSISQEAIDMIGGNGFTNSNNIVRNNKIIANFQSGIRPAKSANYNIIENNYIEFKKGEVTNIAGIYLFGDGTAFSTPKGNQIIKNTVIGGKSGIELSGSDDNFIIENMISGSDRGISLVKDSFYGADVAPKNNKISQNVIDNINYGIYTSSSLNNVITNNVINNYKITDIFR